MNGRIQTHFIPPYPKNEPQHTSKINDGRYLDIAEAFTNTIQGEGVNAGVPAVFLRMQGCTLDCSWCDTYWQKGWRYTFNALFDLLESTKVIDHLFIQRRHLVLTGGSPVKQQDRLSAFIKEFINKYNFKPYIEVENECTIIPTMEFNSLVDRWTNSPKLANSGMKEAARIKPDVLKWFENHRTDHTYKFVITKPEDVQEIQNTYLLWIDPRKIILMPEGQTPEEISEKRQMVFDICMRYGWRYSTREQVFLKIP